MKQTKDIIQLNCSLEISKGVILLAFENKDLAEESLLKLDVTHYNRVFEGNNLDLLEKAEQFAMPIDSYKYKDYYYGSWGFGSAERSIQSAIWKIEDTCKSPTRFNYFLVMQRL